MHKENEIREMDRVGKEYKGSVNNIVSNNINLTCTIPSFTSLSPSSEHND